MLSKKLAIDLGTVNSIVSIQGRGIVLQEPTVVAVSNEDEKIIAVGSDAWNMYGKAPDEISVIRPLRDGVIADYVSTESLLKYFVSNVSGKSWILRPDIVVSIPVGATSVESRAVLDAAYAAGARQAFLVPEPLAAAIGAGFPIAEPSGNMIVNIGGGTTEIAVVSLYGMVVSSSVRFGGSSLDQAISQHVRRKYGLIIGDATAEQVKIDIGSANPNPADSILEVKGRDAVSGFPKLITVSSKEISQCLAQPISQMALAIKLALEKTPPELASDIVEKGIVLSGGTAMLKDIDMFLMDYTGVPVHTADQPIFCVVKGLNQVLDHLELFSKNMIKR